MKNLSLFCFLYLLTFTAHSQMLKFDSASGPVPDNSCTAANEFPIVVSGVGVLGNTNVLDQIEINITMNYDSDLNISLVSPNGVEVALAYGEGADGDNFTHTIFRSDATITLSQGFAPFTGVFLPNGDLKAFNTLQADGTWKLRICDLG